MNGGRPDSPRGDQWTHDHGVHGRAELLPAVPKIVKAWCLADHASAFLDADHHVIDGTTSLRALVVESVLRHETGRDLFHAFGALGRALAERGGSPTLAAGTVDRLLAALADYARSQEMPVFSLAAIPLRAAFFESYVHALTATYRDDARRDWEVPACIVTLEPGVVAIAAGHPDDDGEALVNWASRVVHAIALKGVRRAVVSGGANAVAAIDDALDLAGIERLDAYKP
jgi:hypothetical protein